MLITIYNGFIIILILMCVSAEESACGCSQMHNLEQLIEKLVRMEIKIEQLEKQQFVNVSHNASGQDSCYCSQLRSLDKLTDKMLQMDIKIEQLEGKYDQILLNKSEKTTPCTKCPEPCFDPWIPFNGSCYWFPRQDANFIDASDLCKQYNAHLVKVENSDENDFIKSRLRSLNDYMSWMSLVANTTERIWKYYETAISPSFTDWASNQPSGGGENCGCFWRDFNYQWNDLSCSYKGKFICEK